jgi:hypothetical protein
MMLLMMLSTQNESPPTISDREQNDPATENPDLAGYKTFTNDEIGISFKYPDMFQRVDSHISEGYISVTVYGEGSAGKSFSGVLEFKSGHTISFDGVTPPDYSAPRGGSIKDTLG